MHEALASARDAAKTAESGAGDLVLVGNPNVGKSALFGALTGTYVNVSNYPGTTVEITTGSAAIGGRRVRVVDTPGTNSFLPGSEDERVTRDILLESRPEAVLVVGDAKNLERTLALAVQVAEMGLPFTVCLNMMDEARSRGIAIDHARLAARLGVDVVATVAVRREGLGRLARAVSDPRVGRSEVAYPPQVEEAAARVASLLPEAAVSAKSLALMALAGDETLNDWLRARVPAATLAVIDDERQRLRRLFREPLAAVIHQARLREAAALAGSSSSRNPRAGRVRGRVGSWIETVATHPVWGFPFLLVVLWACYGFVGVLGADTLVGWLEEGLFGRWINPVASRLVEAWVPWGFLRDLIVGPYGVLTMALTYALALVLPIVGTFFIAFGVLEDSGYLPRLAVMVHRLFRRIGLNGKAVLPMVLGLGCDTMATLTTRILETRKERLIVIILLALGVPCSAQLTVVLAMLGSLSLTATAIWVGVVTGVILLVGALSARVIPGRGGDFVLELPPMRLPAMRNILVKTVARIEWYLKEAVPLFVLGTLILFFADRLRLLGGIQRAAEPVLSGVLGLPVETAEAFVIGFLRRDFGAAGLYHMAEDGALSPAQVLVAVVTITLFIPCIANFFMIVKERGWRTGLAISAFIVPFAIAVGGALSWILRVVPIPLT